MVNTPKSNKLKRKRGKKFVYREAGSGKDSKSEQTSNPFEEHSKTKRVKKEEDQRKELINEYRKLGKTHFNR